MNDTHFDQWMRSLLNLSSRRGLVRGFTASLGLAAIAGPDMADAGQRRKRKRRRRQKRRKRRRQDPATPPPFCTGIDVCQGQEIPCEASGPECRCFVREETGDPFCGENMSLSPFPVCEACAPDETCVTCMGGVLCARPCPNPL